MAIRHADWRVLFLILSLLCVGFCSGVWYWFGRPSRDEQVIHELGGTSQEAYITETMRQGARWDDLEASFPHATDSTLRQLAESAASTSIAMLNLNGSNVTDKGMAYLMELPRLRMLDLSGTKITDNGLAPLVNLRLWNCILSDTAITDEGLEHLAGLKSLQYVRLDDTNVTDEGVKKLQQALPDCDIRFHRHRQLRFQKSSDSN